MLPSIDIEGQNQLLDAHVLILGLGGLGCPAATYLAAAGVGSLTLVDPDNVDLSNLQRQILHTKEDIGQPKVTVSAKRLLNLNPDITVDCIKAKLNDNELTELMATADVVLDATDNFSSRFAINKASVKTSTPLVSGAAIRMTGQLAVYDPRQAESPCYQCLYPEDMGEELSCSESGILGPVVGTIGTMQAIETIKFIVGSPPATPYLMVFDAVSMQWQKMTIQSDPDCPVCNMAEGKA